MKGEFKRGHDAGRAAKLRAVESERTAAEREYLRRLVWSVRIQVYAELPRGLRFMGQGRTLAEALTGLVGCLPDSLDTPEIETIRKALAAPGFSVEIRSVAKWWNPRSWGRVVAIVKPEGL